MPRHCADFFVCSSNPAFPARVDKYLWIDPDYLPNRANSHKSDTVNSGVLNYSLELTVCSASVNRPTNTALRSLVVLRLSGL